MLGWGETSIYRLQFCHWKYFPNFTSISMVRLYIIRGLTRRQSISTGFLLSVFVGTLVEIEQVESDSKCRFDTFQCIGASPIVASNLRQIWYCKPCINVLMGKTCNCGFHLAVTNAQEGWLNLAQALH